MCSGTYQPSYGQAPPVWRVWQCQPNLGSLADQLLEGHSTIYRHGHVLFVDFYYLIKVFSTNENTVVISSSRACQLRDTLGKPSCGLHFPLFLGSTGNNGNKFLFCLWEFNTGCSTDCAVRECIVLIGDVAIFGNIAALYGILRGATIHQQDHHEINIPHIATEITLSYFSWENITLHHIPLPK
nr:hypothetical protein Itr_chr13CG02470 [Ipomoea trifida]